VLYYTSATRYAAFCVYYYVPCGLLYTARDILEASSPELAELALKYKSHPADGTWGEHSRLRQLNFIFLRLRLAFSVRAALHRSPRLSSSRNDPGVARRCPSIPAVCLSSRSAGIIRNMSRRAARFVRTRGRGRLSRG